MSDQLFQVIVWIVITGAVMAGTAVLIAVIAHQAGWFWERGRRASADASLLDFMAEWHGWLDQPVALKLKAGPEVYFGNLQSASGQHIHIVTETGADIRFFCRPSEIGFFGPYDPAKMREAQAQAQMNAVVSRAMSMVGSDVAH